MSTRNPQTDPAPLVGGAPPPAKFSQKSREATKETEVVSERSKSSTSQLDAASGAGFGADELSSNNGTDSDTAGAAGPHAGQRRPGPAKEARKPEEQGTANQPPPPNPLPDPSLVYPQSNLPCKTGILIPMKLDEKQNRLSQRAPPFKEPCVVSSRS